MMPAMRALIGSTSMETSIHFKIKRLSNTDLYFKEKLLQMYKRFCDHKFRVKIFPNWTKMEIDDLLSKICNKEVLSLRF